MNNLLFLAAKFALPRIPNDPRNYHLGCVGIRADGVLVSSQNGAVSGCVKKHTRHSLPEVHAEVRVIKKLGKYGTIYVARVNKINNGFTMAKPCKMCETLIRSAKVNKVYYSISDSEYGIWFVKKNIHKIKMLKNV